MSSWFVDTTVTWPEALFLQNHAPAFLFILLTEVFVNFVLMDDLRNAGYVPKMAIPSDSKEGRFVWALAWIIYAVLIGFGGYFNRIAFGPVTDLTNWVLAIFLMILIQQALQTLAMIVFTRHGMYGRATLIQLVVLVLNVLSAIFAFVETEWRAGIFLTVVAAWTTYLFIIMAITFSRTMSKKIPVVKQDRFYTRVDQAHTS